jgi:hypothetical protein
MYEKLLSLYGSLRPPHFVGRLWGLSDEQRQFFADGYKCPSCHARLLNAAGVMTVNFYVADGTNFRDGDGPLEPVPTRWNAQNAVVAWVGRANPWVELL